METKGVKSASAGWIEKYAKKLRPPFYGLHRHPEIRPAEHRPSALPAIILENRRFQVKKIVAKLPGTFLLAALVFLLPAPRALGEKPTANPAPPEHSGPKTAAPSVRPIPESLRRLVERGQHAQLLEKLEAGGFDLDGRRNFLRGYALLRLGRQADALPSFQLVLEELPALRAYTLFYLAEAAEGTKEAGQERRALEELLQTDPKGPLAPSSYERVAALDLREGAPLRAAARLGRLLRYFPQEERGPAILAMRAEALEEGGRRREAALAWRELWRTHPESGEAGGALDRAGSLAAGLTPPLPAPGAVDHYRRARLLQKRYYYDKALAAYGELKLRYPNSPYRRRIALQEALALYALRRTPEAGDALWQSIQLFSAGSPERAKARYYQTRNHLRARDRDAFESDARTLLKESGKGEWAAKMRYLFARVHEDDSEYEDAGRYYREVAARHQGSSLVPQALWQIAWIHLRQRRPESAYAGFSSLSRRHASHFLQSSSLYWAAAAAEAAGEAEKAVAAYRESSQVFRHTYFGHLARAALDRLAQNGNLLAEKPLALRDAGYENWIKIPAGPYSKPMRVKWRAAQLLSSMGFHRHAGEEYSRLTARPFFQYRAARAFAKGGEHSRAFRILASHFWDAIRSGGKDLPAEFWRIAYPLSVKRKEAGGADPLLVNAIIKAESAFEEKALSRAGARGLMQLMPATARRLAKAHKFKLASADQLFDPAINVRLGARHLGDLLKDFGGAVVPAIASYNAGRRVVKRWWSARKDEPLETFIERIPYQETRNYVKRVLGYYWEYQRIYPQLGGNGARGDRPS